MRAYFIHLEEGGDAHENWVRAEREAQSPRRDGLDRALVRAERARRPARCRSRAVPRGARAASEPCPSPCPGRTAFPPGLDRPVDRVHGRDVLDPARHEAPLHERGRQERKGKHEEVHGGDERLLAAGDQRERDREAADRGREERREQGSTRRCPARFGKRAPTIRASPTMISDWMTTITLPVAAAGR